MSRLRFKGAPPKNLKSAHKVEKYVQSRGDVSPVVVDEEEPEGWVLVETVEDLSGPLVLISNQQQVISIDEDGHQDGDEMISPVTFEPSEVRQVFVGKSLLPGIFCIKSAYGKYLSSDHLGKVTASKEAVGSGERWHPEVLGDGKVSFRSTFERFLSFQNGNLRADSDEVGSSETFLVKCQAAERWRRLRAAADPKTIDMKVDPRALEMAELKKYHSYTSGGIRKDDAALEAAQREGRLREELLERRIKSKHDKFC